MADAQPMKQSSPLAPYFEANPSESHTGVAGRASIALDTFRAYVYGRRKPKVDHALAIARATNGAVPVEAWEGFRPAAPAPSAPSASSDSDEAA